MRLRAEVMLDGVLCEARVLDLGFGGAKLAMEKSPLPGDVLRLSLVAPSLWDPLVLQSRVVWSRGELSAPELSAPEMASLSPARFRTFGVAFAHATPRGVLALHELISALAYE